MNKEVTEARYVEGLIDLYPGFQRETFINYRQANESSIRFPDDLWLRYRRYDILEEPNYDLEHFTPYQWLTRVGFNHDYTQALVYMGGYCGMMCGGASVYILEKVEGRWVVMTEKQVLFF